MTTATSDQMHATGTHRLALGFIVLTTIGWALFAWLARLPAPAFDDTLEAWSWGQHFELGYYKHPPLFAWVAGLWFRVMPHQDWAAYLLSSLMVGIGLGGVYALVSRIWSAEGGLGAMALLMLTPFHTIMAANFNANTVLLALWPWTAYALVRLLETSAIGWGALFGLVAGLSMLSKYASVLMLAGCGAALLLHPNRWRVLTSPAPWVAVIVGTLVIAPHVWWLVQNDYPPFSYALEKTGEKSSRFVWKAVTTGLAGLAMLVPALIAWRVAIRDTPRRARMRDHLVSFAVLDRRWLLPLILAPFVLTIAVGLTGKYKIATNFLIPTVFLMPLLLMVGVTGALPMIAARRMLTIALGYMALAIVVAAPIAAIVTARANPKNQIDPTEEIAIAATAAWRETFKVPVKIVAGTEMYELAATFYSPDSPIEFTHFNRRHAPWITPERIARDGLLAICKVADARCLADAEPWVKPGTIRKRITVAPKLLGFQMPGATVDLVMIPPG